MLCRLVRINRTSSSLQCMRTVSCCCCSPLKIKTLVAYTLRWILRSLYSVLLLLSVTITPQHTTTITQHYYNTSMKSIPNISTSMSLIDFHKFCLGQWFQFDCMLPFRRNQAEKLVQKLNVSHRSDTLIVTRTSTSYLCCLSIIGVTTAVMESTVPLREGVT